MNLDICRKCKQSLEKHEKGNFVDTYFCKEEFRTPYDYPSFDSMSNLEVLTHYAEPTTPYIASNDRQRSAKYEFIEMTVAGNCSLRMAKALACWIDKDLDKKAYYQIDWQYIFKCVQSRPFTKISNLTLLSRFTQMQNYIRFVIEADEKTFI